MKKTLAIMLCVICLLTLIGGMTGCADTKENGGSRTVVDMQGNTIQLPEKVEKYCTVYSSAVPMLAMLDQNMEHCVMYPKSGYFEYWEFEMFDGIADHAERVNKREVTAEQIIESGTQVLFWNKASHQELVDSLTEMGIACVNVQVKNADDLLKALNIIAEVLDTDYARNQLQKYQGTFNTYKEYVEKQVAQIPENEKKSILVLGDTDSLTAYATSNYAAYWSNLVGTKFIESNTDGADEVKLTMEQVYEFEPDIILVNSIFDVATLCADPAWSALGAVQDNMLLSNPSVLDFWAMPTTEAPLQYLWALNKFYPEYAGDMDLLDATISFYKEFYGYELSVTASEAIIASTHFLMSN